MRRFTRITHFFSSHRGFSLIELLIVIAIIALISGIILMRYGAFNSVILLKNLAYEIAITTREAQTYGVSVRSNAGTFQSWYGIHFEKATPKAYTLFIDKNSNGVYDTSQDSNAEERIITYQIGSGNSITDLCANASCGLDRLDITFRRPEPDANFYARTGASVVTNVTDAHVVVQDANQTNRRGVRIWATGQIAVE